MFQKDLASLAKEQEYKVQSQLYGQYQLVDQQNNPPRSVFQIQSQMRTRDFNKVGPFYHNQNYIPLTNSNRYPTGLADSIQYYRPQRLSTTQNQANNSLVNRNSHVGQVAKEQTFPREQQEIIGENLQQKSGFSCTSCILVVSLLILAILAGFLFLVLTNQLEQTKYFVLTKLGLWKHNQPQVFYGSSKNSHPVIDKTIKSTITKEQKSQKSVPGISLRKQTDKDLLIAKSTTIVAKPSTQKNIEEKQVQKQPLTIKPLTTVNKITQPITTVTSQIIPTVIQQRNSLPQEQKSNGLNEFIQSSKIEKQNINQHKTMSHHIFNPLRHYTN